MSEVIFQRTSCLKRDVFDTIVDLMKGAGWQDVAYDPAKEWVILNSKGESGDQDLYVQMRSANHSNSNDTKTTNYNVMSLRLISGYKAAEKAVGIIERPGEAWRSFYMLPNTGEVSMDNTMTIWYHVNKNRIILTIEAPESLGILPSTHYLGLPETFIDEPGSKGLIFASSTYAVTASAVLVTDNADALAPVTASPTRNSYLNLPPKSPNSGGKHTPIQMYYGNTQEGYRGRIDGLYFLPANSVTNGDELNVGNKKFRCVVNGVASNNSFTTNTVLFQIQ